MTLGGVATRFLLLIIESVHWPLSYVAEHVVLHAPLHGDGFAVFVFDAGLATVAREAGHFLPEFLVLLEYGLLLGCIVGCGFVCSGFSGLILILKCWSGVL